jgi:hypothetical protein
MVAHIWGDKPEQFREMSFGLAEMGFKGIDLNMGCVSGLNIKPEPLPFFATLATGHPIFKSIPLKPISGVLV